MDLSDTAEYRKKRLQDFVDQKVDGNKAALGRSLGYRDGAFVGQMLRGERPITEKTVDQIHALAGGRGWFSVGEGSNAAPWPFSAEMLAKVSQLKPDKLVYLENAMRNHLQMEFLTSPEAPVSGNEHGQSAAEPRRAA